MEDDKALLALWSDGDAHAGRELVERHFDALYRFFYNKAGTHIDDLVQETFATCLESAQRFRGDSSFRTYLLGIARNKLLAWYRQGAADARKTASGDSAEARGMAPIDAVEQNQEQRILLRSLRKLTIESQILLELAYWEELKDREIAEILEVPVGTAKSRIRKARLMLRDKIEQTLAETQFDSTVDKIDAWLESMRRRSPAPAR